MKSVFAIACLLASVFFAGGNAANNAVQSPVSANAGYNIFSCKINGSEWPVANATEKNISVTCAFTSCANNRLSGFFINAEEKEGQQKSTFNIQPLNDNAPAAFLQEGKNIYKEIYITYKAADDKFFCSTNSPGNFEITAIDSVHKTVQGRFSCILLTNTGKDCLLITSGRFCFNFSEFSPRLSFY